MSGNEYKRIKELQDDFIRICNERYTEDKYYKVMVSTYYDTYEGEVFSAKTKIYIDLLRMREVPIYGFWGNFKRVNKVCAAKEEIGVYAVKKSDGIYEMVTGRKLYIAPTNNCLCCFGLEPIKENEIVKASEDLKILDIYPQNKTTYINALSVASNNACKKCEEMQNYLLSEKKAVQDKEKAMQYLKSYNHTPRN